jgi:uncharacterized membrane protein YdjX (TVP38/TMEM64 family)
LVNRTQWAKAAAVGVSAILLMLVAWSYANDGIVRHLLSRELSAAEKMAQVREFFDSLGAAAPAVYVVLTTAEVVVAPLPGAILHIPAGVIFGGFWGGLLALIGNVLGAGLACQLMRTLGRGYAERLVASTSLQQYESRLAGSGLVIIFILRINPLTSSDLVSYAAGLTPIPIWKVMLGTLLGMAPLCWGQAYLADSVLSAFPSLLYPLLIFAVLSLVCAAGVLRKLVADDKIAVVPDEFNR